MFTKADILARLQNGETTDTIANEMANLLNEAEAEKKAMDAQIVAQERENARIMDAKRAAVDNMLDAICDYLVVAGEGDRIDEVKDIKTDKIIDLLDGTIEMSKRLEKLKGLEFPFSEFHKAATINPKVHKIVVDASADNADKVIGDFLKSFGL